MVTRVFVEKKPGFNIEATQLRSDLKGNLGISGLQEVRILNRYDVSGLSEEQFAAAARTVLSEPPMDAVYGEDFRLPPEYRVFATSTSPASMTSGPTPPPSACSCSPGRAAGGAHRQSHRPEGAHHRGGL